MSDAPSPIFIEMITEHWLSAALPDSTPPSILVSADLLVTKTAFLAGMVSPGTAACLSNLLMTSDSQYSRISDGHHAEPQVLKDALNSANKQSTRMKVPELRRRTVAALAHHCHLLHTQAFPDEKGSVASVVIHQHLAQLGLHPHLWSLARGLALRHEEYHALAPTHRTRVSIQLDSTPRTSLQAFLEQLKGRA